uniref:Uncharacterized protein n=1 Tax=Rhizophora mucronata TaxID=61149 RepID=A0A2P2LJH9_RHIMU
MRQLERTMYELIWTKGYAAITERVIEKYNMILKNHANLHFKKIKNCAFLMHAVLASKFYSSTRMQQKRKSKKKKKERQEEKSLMQLPQHATFPNVFLKSNQCCLQKSNFVSFPNGINIYNN